MRLLSWMDAGVWSSAHISHIGEPLCATPMPDHPQATRERPAEIRDWPYVCADCRALAIKGVTEPGAFCECNHPQASHANGAGACLDCRCDVYRFDPIYEPTTESV